MKLNFFNARMMANTLCVCGIFPILLSGCSGYLYDPQAPAPVYKSGTTDKTNDTYSLGSSESNDLTASQGLEAGESQTSLSDENEKQMSPAVLALVADADKSVNQGDFDSAVITIERALRIDSRNPVLTYKLAAIRLKQRKPRLAEDLAKKAALLSANNRVLKKQCWLLISEARKQQSNLHGAEEARLKANQL